MPSLVVTNPEAMANAHYDVLIIGGGTAGIMTAAQLHRKDRKLRIAILTPPGTTGTNPHGRWWPPARST